MTFFAIVGMGVFAGSITPALYMVVMRGGVVTLINPRRACAARITVLGLSVLPSVRLSGTPYSATTRNKAAKVIPTGSVPHWLDF